MIQTDDKQFILWLGESKLRLEGSDWRRHFAEIIDQKYAEYKWLNKGENMNILDFRVLISEFEGLKKEVDIAQISEILFLVNVGTDKELYKSIRKLSIKSARMRLKDARKC